MRVRRTLGGLTLVVLLFASAFVALAGESDGAAERAVRPTAARRAARSETPPTSAVPAPEPAPAVAPAPPPPPPPPPPPAPGGRKVLVVGDSIAEFVARHLGEVAHNRQSTIVNAGVWGCGVIQGGPLRYFGATLAQPANCDDWPQRWQQAVAAHSPDVVLLMVGRWEVMDRVLNGGWTHIGDPAYDDHLRALLDHAVSVLTSHGANVAVATAPYYRRGLRPDGGLWPEDEQPRVDRFNTILHEVAARHPDRMKILPFGQQVTPGGFTMDVAGIHVRSDGVHLSQDGARWVSPWLLEELLRAAPAR